MLDTLAQLDLTAHHLLPIHPTLRHPHTGERLRALGYRRNGEPIWPMLGAADGDADDNSDEDSEDDDSEEDEDEDDEEDDDRKLGPKGERALAAEKEKRRRARAAQRKAEQKATELQAELDRLKGGKKKADDGDEDAGKQAEARANAKIVRAEVKALAADTFIDAGDAARYLDLSRYEVDEDGDLVDPDELKDDLADLLKRKPHLAKKRQRFQGDGDGGNRGAGKKPDPGPGRNRLRAAYAASSKTKK